MLIEVAMMAPGLISLHLRVVDGAYLYIKANEKKISAPITTHFPESMI